MTRPHPRITEATETLRALLAHARPLADLGISVEIPDELVLLAREITRITRDRFPDEYLGSDLTYPVSQVDPDGDLGRASDVSSDPSSAPERVPRMPMREAILTVMKEDELVSVKEVRRRLINTGYAANNPNSISNELSNWAKAGVLEKPSRGNYRRPRGRLLASLPAVQMTTELQSATPGDYREEPNSIGPPKTEGEGQSM